MLDIAASLEMTAEGYTKVDLTAACTYFATPVLRQGSNDGVEGNVKFYLLIKLTIFHKWNVERE